MNEPPELRHNGSWRTAVWSLRVGYVGLAVALVGLVLTLSGSTRWILAVGVIAWLCTVPVTLMGFVRARNQLPEPRPTFWSMRFMLIHDSAHALPAGEPS